MRAFHVMHNILSFTNSALNCGLIKFRFHSNKSTTRIPIVASKHLWQLGVPEWLYEMSCSLTNFPKAKFAPEPLKLGLTIIKSSAYAESPNSCFIQFPGYSSFPLINHQSVYQNIMWTIWWLYCSLFCAVFAMTQFLCLISSRWQIHYFVSSAPVWLRLNMLFLWTPFHQTMVPWSSSVSNNYLIKQNAELCQKYCRDLRVHPYHCRSSSKWVIIS